MIPKKHDFQIIRLSVFNQSIVYQVHNGVTHRTLLLQVDISYLS